MKIDWQPNERPTMGVEVELMIVDAETGDLTQLASQILTDVGAEHPGGEHPKAKHELFQSIVEIITGVCETPADAYADLAATMTEVSDAAAARGGRLVGLATHPFAEAKDQLVSPAPRYHQLIERMQWPARRLLICGVHVHVGVKSGERAITIINEMRRYLPLFLALSASSPYFEGDDTGLASARSKVFEGLPTAGLPPQLAAWSDFEEFMQTLLDTGCITSIREVWWDVRPHPGFGTIELRMCDAMPTLTDTIAVAALTQALVATIDARIDDGTLGAPPREWVVRENRWLAGRHGLAADLIVEEPGGVRKRPARELVAELVEEVRPAAELIGSVAELEGVLRIAAAGSGAERQRALIGDGATLADVVHQLARDLADSRSDG